MCCGGGDFSRVNDTIVNTELRLSLRLLLTFIGRAGRSVDHLVAFDLFEAFIIRLGIFRCVSYS